MRLLRIVSLAVLVAVAGLAATDAEKSLVGDWLMRPAAAGESAGKGPGILVTFALEADRLTGKAAQPQGHWPLTDIRYDGRVLSFRVHNGEEFLEARLQRVDEGFDGSYVGSETRQAGRLTLSRKK